MIPAWRIQWVHVESQSSDILGKRLNSVAVSKRPLLPPAIGHIRLSDSGGFFKRFTKSPPAPLFKRREYLVLLITLTLGFTMAEKHNSWGPYGQGTDNWWRSDKDSLRESDSVARYGGEEFAVILKGILIWTMKVDGHVKNPFYMDWGI